MSEFPQRLEEHALRVNRFLAGVLDQEVSRGTPPRLLAAMRHAVLGGGKRFRPFLTIECAGLFGTPPELAIPSAAAVECVHCYSLVHDDLPCMDNDEMRRGTPTVWKAFDDWTAVLAGDALQALAFDILSRPESLTGPAASGRLIAVLAGAAGASGMVGGQSLDLEAERLKGDESQTAQHVAHLQAMKTGRLIGAACEMGAVLGNASRDEQIAIRHYGDCLGFAYQISDDLLDAEGNAAAAGKATGKDAVLGKATLVSLLGVEQTRNQMDKVVAEAIAALNMFGQRSLILAEAARYLGRRTK